MGPQRKDDSKTRLSPGEAAFRRLRERDAVRQEARKLPRPPRAVAPVHRKAPARRPEDIEASLRDQLRSLEADIVKEDTVPSEASPPQRPRSVFAPDPVRQRSYFDLRKSPPAKAGRVQGAVSGDTPRALVEPSARRYEDAGLPVAGVPDRSLAALPTSARDRGLDARSLSIAALIGVGIGFLGLTFMAVMTRPEAPTVVTTSLESEPSALAGVDADAIRSDATTSVVTPAPSPASTKEQARLLPVSESEPATLPEPEPKPELQPLRGTITPEDDIEVNSEVAVEAPPVAAAEKQQSRVDEPTNMRPADPASVVVAAPAPVADTAPVVGGRILSYAPVERPENP
ncbi:MAG: hypothetical protein GY798_05485, partial [Hyphomicrobiales bacterium]|nr:hypothetical protein [Hyphomicrobiales bacterium]